MATTSGIYKSVVISSTAVSIGSPVVTYALSITAPTDCLAVDLDTDASGNIKSLRVDAIVANTTANALAPTSILELQFPNNPPSVVASETAAVSVTLTA
jgi:hypothetical protein